MKKTLTRVVRALLIVFVVTGCNTQIYMSDFHDQNVIEPMSVSEGASSGSFFFLPPLAKDSHAEGVFDSSLKPVVVVDDISDPSWESLVFTIDNEFPSERVRVDIGNEWYQVNLHTKRYSFNTMHIYRIRILIAGTGLGHTDVRFARRGNRRKRHVEGAVTLKKGRTLPIKFRIEEGAVYPVSPGEETVVEIDEVVELSIPVGAVTNESGIGITVDNVEIIPGDGLSEAGAIPGAVFEFGPDGTEFAESVTMKIGYTLPLPPGIVERTLTLFSIVDGEIIEIESTVDPASQTVSGDIMGFSTHGLKGGELSFDTWTVQEIPGAAGDTPWVSIASSSSAQYLAACSGASTFGSIYTSSDYGVTWTERIAAGQRSWRSIASSADGFSLVACVGGSEIGAVYTSNDAGANWAEHFLGGESHNWSSVASSADGSKLVAVAGGVSIADFIFTSPDSGNTWIERSNAGSRHWISVACSSDGMNIVAVAYGDYIYVSNDGGITWAAQDSAGIGQWFSVASSADGLKLVAGTYDVQNPSGAVYTYSESNGNWIENTSAGAIGWAAITSSSDGSVLAACGGDKQIYTSVDSGTSWIVHPVDNSKIWSGIACSDDGALLAAVAYGSSAVYTSP